MVKHTQFVGKLQIIINIRSIQEGFFKKFFKQVESLIRFHIWIVDTKYLNRIIFSQCAEYKSINVLYSNQSVSRSVCQSVASSASQSAGIFC